MNRLSFLLVVMLVTPASAAGQATGVIAGTVRTAEGQALSGARIYVVDSSHGTISDAGGQYSLEGVPAGSYVIVAALLGYQDGRSSVTVTAGGITRVDFTLRETAVALDRIVVTASSGCQSQRVLG